MNNKRAIIIGAGIAGPIAAIELKKLGYEVSIYEARPYDPDSMEGVFLGLTPNGLNILKEYISLDELAKISTPGAMRFYNRKGVEIGAIPTEYQLEAYGCETLQTKRWWLNELIRRCAREHGVEILYGKTCKEVREHGSGVEVTFQDREVTSGDLLIGCDGAFSTVRKSIFPGQPRPRYTEVISTAGYAEAGKIAVESGVIHMVFGSRGFFAYSLSGGGEVWWFNNYYRKQEPGQGELQKILSDEIKHNLLDLHKDDLPAINQIIRATPYVFAYPIYDLPKLDRWHTRRVCLLGDSAHATSPHIGQGASLALEDVQVLVQCMKHSDDPEVAFQTYQNLRKERVDKIVSSARKIGSTKSKTGPVAAWFRDRFLGKFIQKEVKKLDWIYGYQPTK